MPEEVQSPSIKIESDDKKSDIRAKVWNFIRDNNLAAFPKPPHRRISNFVGSEEAGNLAATLPVFQSAKNVRIDPDRPLMQVRIRTLEEGKALYMPTPGVRNHVISKVVQQKTSGNKRLLRSSMTRQAVMDSGEPVDIDTVVKMDLVLVGCVAVSPRGWRIGKGSGLSDLEYAMMRSTGSIDGSVPVITIVHDCQVLDLPSDLFAAHDVPVDFIVTPTRIITCADHVSLDNSTSIRPEKPLGLIWSLVSDDLLNRVQVLSRLRYREWKSGKNVLLLGETEQAGLQLTDEIKPEVGKELDVKIRSGRPSRSRNSRPKKVADGGVEKGATDSNEKLVQDSVKNVENKRFSGNRRSDIGRQRRTENGRSKNEVNATKESNEEIVVGIRDRNEGGDGCLRNSDKPKAQISVSGKGEELDRKPEKGGRRRFDYKNAVFVGALPRSVRVSEFKAEVRERKVKPTHVMWRGSSGFAFLNFRTVGDAELALEALSGLQVSDKSVKLEMARSPTSRTSVDGVRGETDGRRRATRRRRNTHRGSNDTDEKGNAGASSVELTAVRHQSEANMTVSNVI